MEDTAKIGWNKFEDQLPEEGQRIYCRNNSEDNKSHNFIYSHDDYHKVLFKDKLWRKFNYKKEYELLIQERDKRAAAAAATLEGVLTLLERGKKK